MDNEGQGAQLQWINSSIGNPNISQDLAIRAKIRKQAMKKAAITRRANGHYGKQNLRQLPVFDQSITEVVSGSRLVQTESRIIPIPDVVNLDPEDDDARPKSPRDVPSNKERIRQANVAPVFRIMNRMSSMGYESARIEFDFDLRVLGSLTTFHVGRACIGTINAHSSHLVQNFRPQWSFFSYVPSRYGENTCLTLATNCLLSRIRQILNPERSYWKSRVILSYVEALRGLQKAIDSPSERYNPEVLCATEILALYEVCKS